MGPRRTGVINSDLQAALAPHGLCFSPDPVSAHLATVAGNIIENAGGPHALKYGVTYNHILSVEVVLANGSTITLAADDDGPDLLGVLIGSEGTLGIVTEATVALRPIPEVTHSLMGAFASARAAADTVAAVIASGVVPAAVEWLDRQGAGLQQFYDTGYPLDADAIVLIDVDGTAGEVAHDQPIVEKMLRERATEVRIAEDEKSRTALWYGRECGKPRLCVRSSLHRMRPAPFQISPRRPECRSGRAPLAVGPPVCFQSGRVAHLTTATRPAPATSTSPPLQVSLQHFTIVHRVGLPAFVLRVIVRSRHEQVTAVVAGFRQSGTNVARPFVNQLDIHRHRIIRGGFWRTMCRPPFPCVPAVRLATSYRTEPKSNTITVLGGRPSI